MSETIKIATLNVWALPLAIADSVQERVDAIAAHLGELDADLVAFQEAWTDDVKQRLAEAGLNGGYATVWYEPRGTGGGLLVLCRRPVLEARFHDYRLKGLPQRVDQGEYYARKGFLHLRLATDEGPVSVLNTHLHAEYTSSSHSDYFGVQTAQIVQFASCLAGISEPVIAPGDYNVHEGNPPYRVLLGLGGLEDCAAVLDHRQATVRKGNPYRKEKTGPDSRVDYVFYRSGATREVRPVSVERIFDAPLRLDGQPAAYSDHDGLLAEFRLTNGSDYGFPRPDSEILHLATELLLEGRAWAERRQMRKRAAAGGCLIAGSLPLSDRFRARLSRRRFLRGATFALPALALPSGAGMLTLSEVFIPEELAAYDYLLRVLDTVWGDG